ncbi:MAG: alpha/beta fold hydrolase [Saprospiraceae bacterium]|nr:alpha/beta fold hydrolase [Saprospiraceae bacterium]MCB9321349.1 alpha/beta fold hydrolase [Lewinellaceae bacterium]
MKWIKKITYTLLALVGLIFIAGLALAYWPVTHKVPNEGITPDEAATLRQQYTGPHEVFTASDGETLFLRRWNPDTLVPAKSSIAVLIFHGFTAYSGPYEMAGIPFSDGGYTTFGLDYRGHGLSGGNRGDSPGKDRWIGDLADAVKYVHSLGYPRVVVLGHSLGVAAAMCAADTVPGEISSLVLLSGAYESRPGINKPIPFMQQARIIASAILRPAYQSVEYYREGMHMTDDTLFTYHYTPRFFTMLDVKKLRLPSDLNIPVLVGVGDRDELFSEEKVKEFYDLIPGDQKEMIVMKNTTHAQIPRESWEQVVEWLDKTYTE